MHTILHEDKHQPLFVENITKGPEIVLIFPITRNNEKSQKKWKALLELVEVSEISTLLVIDKTIDSCASKYFIKNFEFRNKRLFVLPRSLEDTLFGSVGEIILDENMWIIQVHDDDYWNGIVTLPRKVSADRVYFFDFKLQTKLNKTVDIKDFSMPNRIVFSLVPSKLWNNFSHLVREQNYHVAGSFDFTLNRMAQLSCEFQKHSGFEYFWKDDNWDTSRNSIRQLTWLAENDGWGNLSSPEVANFNRSIDSIASLLYVKQNLSKEELRKEISLLINGFKPKIKRRIKFKIVTLIILTQVHLQKMLLSKSNSNKLKTNRFLKLLTVYQFIEKTWTIESIQDLKEIIEYLESYQGLEKLHVRFHFWKNSLQKLSEGL